MKLTDNPKPGEERRADLIYVGEYLKFADAAFYLTTFSQLFIPTVSEKSITVSKEVLKLRDELFEQYKDQLTNPVILAKVEKILIEADKASLSGDESEGFLNTSSKSWNIVRKKLFLRRRWIW